MSYLNRVEQQREHNRQVEERRKRKKQIASLEGQAGAALQRASMLRAEAQLPYTAERRWFGVKGTCNVCSQPLERGWAGLSVIPHTPVTCLGPGGRVQAK